MTDIENVIALIVAIAVAAYLIRALLRADRIR